MAAADPALRVEIARSGGLAKGRNKTLTARRAADLAQHIRSVVDELPPLSEVQRARLAALLLSGRPADGPDAA